ncbi:hypothetical protein [Streptomyces sp. NPDC101455]|uniref:hypothetical protein n=1 Tax=Streptomyces sp. NPDC101455 TaxID=3366142 RepID=UPI0037F1DDD8
MTSVVTISFSRPVHVHELRSGDIFVFPDAAHTALIVLDTREIPVSPELVLVCLTLTGCEPISLPRTTPVTALRMVRKVALKCLLCGKPTETELNLPKDGEPISVVCDDHDPTGTAVPTA